MKETKMTENRQTYLALDFVINDQFLSRKLFFIRFEKFGDNK